MGQLAVDISSGTLERLAVAGGPFAAVIALLTIVQLAVLMRIQHKQVRVALLAGTASVQLIAALGWIVVELTKQGG